MMMGHGRDCWSRWLMVDIIDNDGSWQRLLMVIGCDRDGWSWCWRFSMMVAVVSDGGHQRGDR